MAVQFDENFAFYEQLKLFYEHNRGKIRSRYNDLTRKYLAYNDQEENPSAYLRKPQFEALEMYVFIKEFMNNAQMYEMFDDWRNKRDAFAEASYYAIHKNGQFSIGEDITNITTDKMFKQMKKYKESYPNYIYALTMGLGKTILMATCIFYEFLLANKYPKDDRFCHNALVFAPDKTVLESLREIITFDKTKVVPLEYARVLDANIKFHFLEESGTTLHTLDDSDFNIIISNTQKIIVKKKRKEEKPADVLFKQGSLLSTVYGDDGIQDDASLLENQRFKKICRLPQLGVYVDEAHHLFGADLEKQIRSASGKKTSLRDTINLLAENTSIVACYNYTGTPYVNKQVLPEVVYAYGLRESIWNGYLKEAKLTAYDNVKSEAFLDSAIRSFWETYGNNEYEGLLPKLAIFASTVEEATDEVRPIVEQVLADLGVPATSILINVGDPKITKNEDVKNFNDLDAAGTEGSQKQFLILVGKGREGWNCRSLFGVAMYRSPKSKVFVLQATMRCLRQITNEQTKASVFLSKDNYDILEDELNKNFNMEIKDMTKSSSEDRVKYKVRVVPPPRTIKLKQIHYRYSLNELDYSKPIDFKLSERDFSKYSATVYEKSNISRDTSIKEQERDDLLEKSNYSPYMLAGEIARYLNIRCSQAARIIKESVDGEEAIVAAINRYSEILYDIVIPGIFQALFEVKAETETTNRELTLLREPKDAGYYEFSADPDLVVSMDNPHLKPGEVEKSFHADTYCFDSNPELQCFYQYIESDKVEEIYFTGMFTSNQGDMAIQYYDPESRRIRQYYPDFFAKMSDGTYQLIEVKGDNMIDDAVVKAKAEEASRIASESGIEYRMYPGSVLMKEKVLENSVFTYQYMATDSEGK